MVAPQSNAHPTVRALADRGLSAATATLRGVVLVQISVAAGTGFAVSPRPWLYLAAVSVVFGVSVPLVFATLVRGPSALTGHLAVADACVATVLLVVLPAAVPQGAVVGTWENWAPGFALNAALQAWVHARAGTALALSVLIGVVEGVVSGASGTAALGTVAANAVTYPGLGLVATGFVQQLRRIGDEADKARADAVRATRALELERYRVTVHDASNVLRQLGDVATPAPLVPSLRQQALVESQRLRSFVDQGRNVHLGGGTVGDALSRALVGFDDLRVVRNTFLGDPTLLDPDTASALALAVQTLLHNVRRHARADTVVLHADRAGTRWEVSVRDDGVGFDPAQPWGFGLRCQVWEEMTRRSVDVILDSVPGEGTCVTLVGHSRD